MERHQRGELRTVEWTSGDGPAERFVVFCHGFGATGTDLVPLGEALAEHLPATRWVFPAALLEPADMADWGGRAWWTLRLAEMMEKLGNAGPGSSIFEELSVQVPDGIDAARIALTAAISEARVEYEDLPFVLGGFSQGAMLTADVAVRQLAKPDRLVLFSGCPIASRDWAELDSIGLPAVVSHGIYDEVLPFPCGELLHSKLATEQACEVEFVAFPGGHQIPHTALSAALDLIAKP